MCIIAELATSLHRNWQLPLGRRFRSLKLYFVLRSYGEIGFQTHQRRLCKLATQFESLILQSPAHFELFTPRSFSLVVFRLRISSRSTSTTDEEHLRAEDALNREFFARAVERDDMHLTATVVDGTYCTRIAIGSPFTRAHHVEQVWTAVKDIAETARATMALKMIE